MKNMGTVVIVGSGLAGWSVARELRRLGSERPVMLVSADSGDFYAKPMLSNALAQGKSPSQLVTTDAHAMAAQLRVELRAQTRVTGIDPAARELATTAGTIRYGALVLALGADPIRLPLGGDAADEVLSVNDLGDYARFRERLSGARSVAILGAGLIGCEFANDLRAADRDVTVIDPAAFPLASLVPLAAGRVLAERMSEAGVHWRLGQTVGAVERAGRGFRLEVNGGPWLDADLVLSAVGLRPRVELARAAGLAVGRGVQVGDRLQTSAAEIYALGDCAEIDGRVRPYVAPIMQAARCLARTLAGEPSRVVFPPMPVVVKTPACPVVVEPAPPGTAGEWRASGQGADLELEFIDADGRLRGFVLTGGRAPRRQAMTQRLDGPATAA